mmetsp:Transcript_16335/g.28006  ORF Transcript_16335/g.28006 Transcript_16335/m.28006 type:complete len:184 (+) Transcript_16335:90-641(+)|eukprot:CAMPEP_0119115920 /NCGR_PEP_ID=MMETSP1180-20130426/52005_1 /TAXON_ID=3052 ORGANISM="Chlamydomonas cf sp, Strain CCMP681" /NCGR_SAMPLE_ID=MMETSP1180 /ASSEMBLY_ACC=CAM_ASM_000741 /LENGTH=183 /DNA_ID=CAMNT_0007105027 /DNA_START=84 /DNA_END=635 /DNA_ORIENTATION=+
MSTTLRQGLLLAKREKAQGSKQGLTAADKSELLQVFQLFDVDGSGAIDAQELLIAMRALGFPVSKADVARSIAEIDTDGGGTVDFTEFQTMVTSASKKDPQQEARQAFELFAGPPVSAASSDRKPKPMRITLDNLRRVAEEAGEVCTVPELQAMIDLADKDESGDVDFQEFKMVLKRAGMMEK